MSLHRGANTSAAARFNVSQKLDITRPLALVPGKTVHMPSWLDETLPPLDSKARHRRRSVVWTALRNHGRANWGDSNKLTWSLPARRHARAYHVTSNIGYASSLKHIAPICSFAWTCISRKFIVCVWPWKPYADNKQNCMLLGPSNCLLKARFHFVFLSWALLSLNKIQESHIR